MPLTIQERYRGCHVTPSTMAFAIHSNGKLYVMDDASNAMVRQRLTDDVSLRIAGTDPIGTPKWMSVTVTGTPQGEQLHVTSIGR
jgi:hypothetical protein